MSVQQREVPFRSKAVADQRSPDNKPLKTQSDGLLTPISQPPRRRQIHLWISEADYQCLRSLAEAEAEPMSRILRVCIRQLVRNAKLAASQVA